MADGRRAGGVVARGAALRRGPIELAPPESRALGGRPRMRRPRHGHPPICLLLSWRLLIRGVVLDAMVGTTA